MVTPEDDLTAILRLARGTVLTPCGAATPAGFGRAHLEVRAATFCTAHVLNGRDLWKVAVKYGRNNEQAAIILASFNVSFAQQFFSQKLCCICFGSGCFVPRVVVTDSMFFL